ncbi:hypothetical protein PMAN_a1515 [Pseudoalteromonas marina]|uniref:alpha/beta hydrolase n=1 Tax=Pseudoalteromonas marina TaxID=267375 RepID=UPI00026D087F|nr:alpha/beta hydrolase-fold protein [Pseudoalteromonas marina]KAF7780484.1 hypothetical protein PMAN_a1515 [Pseudoalteromonas marina]
MSLKINKNYLINLVLAVITLSLLILGGRYYNHYVSAYTDIKLDSKILNESRKVFIRLPVNYDTNKVYSLIIKTDGNFNLDTWNETLASFSNKGQAEQAILVSIPNLFFTATRNRDLVPPYARQDVNTQAPATNNIEPNGEADKFLQFIELELLPYLTNRFKLNNNRILSGFSAGGSFVLYTLHTKPDLFNGYFAFSPAAWYDDMTVVNKVDSFLQASNKRFKKPTYLFLSVGEEEHPLMLEAYSNLEQALKASPNEHLKWESVINPNAEHNDNPRLSVADALGGYQKFLNKRP